MTVCTSFFFFWIFEIFCFDEISALMKWLVDFNERKTNIKSLEHNKCSVIFIFQHGNIWINNERAKFLNGITNGAWTSKSKQIALTTGKKKNMKFCKSTIFYKIFINWKIRKEKRVSYYTHIHSITYIHILRIWYTKLVSQQKTNGIKNNSIQQNHYCSVRLRNKS